MLDTSGTAIDPPAYIPVTTFGEKYPLDDVIRPYLPRLAQGVMVSFHYARQMEESQRLDLPLLIDSGGFSALRGEASIEEKRGLGTITMDREKETEVIHPRDVLDLQEKRADVAFTLDFPITSDLPEEDAEARWQLTIENARWALSNRRRQDMPLFASVQGWDKKSYRECAQILWEEAFDGYAIGGLAREETERARAVVEAVQKEIWARPLHVFGIGAPEAAKTMFEAGATSVDSSSYVQAAAQGRLWGRDRSIPNPSLPEKLHAALSNLSVATGQALPLSSKDAFFTTSVLEAATG